MKKVMSVALLMIASLCAVFASGSDEKKSVSEKGMTKTVTLANDKLVSVDYSIIDEFEKTAEETTGVKLNISSSPDTASYQTVIQQSIRDSSAPGLLTWWSGPQLNKLVSNDLLYNLDDIWDNYLIPQGLSEDIKTALSYEGHAYAVPYSILYNVTFYNKDVFEKAGIEKEPETFSEFLEACQKIKDSGVTPIGIKNDSWAGFIWFQQMISIQSPQLYLDLCDGTKKYTDPEVVEAMQVWKDMIDADYFSKPMPLLDWRKSLATGSIAMMLEPTPEITVFGRDYGLVSDVDFGSFAVPSATGDKRSVFFEIAPIAVAKSSSELDSALEALKKWYNKDLQTFFYENLGIVNTSTVVVDDPIYKEIMDYTADSENYALLLRYYENTPENVRNVALDQFMKFQLKNVGVEEMLETIQKEADKVFSY